MSKQVSGLREFGGFRLDVQKKILWHRDEAIDLPLKEIELLSLLTEGGELVTKDEIWQRVWGNQAVEETNLTSKIYRLRKLFEKYGESADWIQSVPRRGYRFTAEIIHYSNNPEIIIERHSISKTLIEEIELSDTPNQKLLPAEKSRRVWIAALIGLILIVGVYLLYQKFSKGETIKSIAVLPLKSFDSANTDSDLRLRVMDSVITKLGKIESISVRPTSSMMKFVESDESAVEIGKKLLVDAILEGRIQREDNRLRITMQLVSVNTGTQIWSGQFDGEADKLLDLQSAISTKLLNEFDLRLSKEQETILAKRSTSNSDAYEEYLKGRYFWNKRTAESLKSAIASFEKAIKLDPNFAEAYNGLADSHYLLVDYGYDTSPKNVELAKENLKKAIQLNPKMADAYTTRGLIQTTYEWNWKAAEESLKKANDLAPNLPNGHHRYGTLLAKLRRFDEAESEMRRAKELDPTSPSINMNLGVVLMQSKKNEEAIEQLRKTLEFDTAFVSAHWYLARTYWQTGNTLKALEEYVKIIDLTGDKVLAKQLESDIKAFGETTAIKNWAEEWEKQASQNNMDGHSIAVLYSFLQNRDETLHWLEKSVAVRHPWSTWINAEPEFDFVRDEPRFQEILKKMNLK